MEQQDLFRHSLTQKQSHGVSEWGTFKDSLKAPVHRWFTYPAGFSFKAVEHSLEMCGIQQGQTVYDPFMGLGTTNVTAKTLGINSIGIEAHPFVFNIAKTKLNWEIHAHDIHHVINDISDKFEHALTTLPINAIEQNFPELILKCYDEETLKKLFVLRNFVLNDDMTPDIRDFFHVVVTALLRNVSKAATGWPYIAPKKIKTTSLNKDALTEFNALALSMLHDIELIKIESGKRYINSLHAPILGDSRNTTDAIRNQSVDHVFTSPPYLNNFDYSDRTRLEMYFWGNAKTWGDISEQVRTRLITSATTQIARTDMKYAISPELKDHSPNIADFIRNAAHELSELRKIKGGKKSYDLMVIGYFNDIFQVLKDVYRVLKPKTKALFVLGDSAPYGVHIPTDKIIGELGVKIGFSDYAIEILRQRGDKWKDNPQQHDVKLQESIVTLSKG
ncbi:DNA modification methylase [Candidatus Moduliflexus flocculans]|uniref:Methyltransferase n=1 Tax=Candidatus Moduliflexus flocculans TaxID=1499966 RepID=A0A0S6VPZ1_9BACT|nr:DNA modification methylase [Candidatus Moduliflexus flocculans]